MRISRHLLLIFALAFVYLLYRHALHYDFVYDDHGAIEENAFLAKPANLWRVLALGTLRDPAVLDGQRPVLLLTHFIERPLYGLNPFGYHVTNLLLHLLVVIFVAALAEKIGVRRPWAVGLIFGLHPMLTEAVQVPSFREDLLVTLFGLLYLLAASRPLSLLPLALALLSKESAIVLPALAAWMWICFPEIRPPPRRAAPLLALGALLAGAYLIVVHAGRGLQAVGSIWNGYSLRWPQNLLAAPALFAESCRLLFQPTAQIADRVISAPAGLTDPRFLFGFSAVFVASIVAWKNRAKHPRASFALGWLLIAFLPVSNLIPLYNPAADRYLYFMAPGAALIIGLIAGKWLTLFVAVLFFSIAAHRLPDWKNDHTLWMKTGIQEPASARAHTWVGLELKKRGFVQAAERHFRDAYRINPQDVSGIINLAIIKGQRGDLAEAEELLRESIRRRPDRREGWMNLAVVLQLQGRHAEADEALARASAGLPN